MTNPGSFRASLLITASALLLTACLQDMTPPQVGACADYPEGTYDFGAIGIGRCLGAPVDLKVYQGPDRTALLVVNSNAYLTFNSGSLLSIDLEDLTARLDEIRASLDLPFEDAEIFPEVILISDADLETSVLPIEGFPGRVVTTVLPEANGCEVVPELGGCPVAFVSNRFSDTTQISIHDYVHASSLTDPLALAPFDVSDPDQADSAWSIEVQDDPFGMAIADTLKGRFLYVVNETSHSVSIVDLDRYPIEPLTQDAVGLISTPGFSDAGSPSFAELADQAVTGDVIGDDWTLSFVEGTYRAWYRTGDDGNSLGWGESGNGVGFSTRATSPLLVPGGEGAWDAGAIRRASVLPYADAYYFYYEGHDAEGRSRIGLAISDDALVGSVSKYDVGGDLDASNDFVVGPSASGLVREEEVGSPWVVQRSEGAYVMWYTSVQSGELSVNTISSVDRINWDVATKAPVRFYANFQDGDLADEVSIPGARDPIGYWDEVADRFHLWFVRPFGDGSCLAYAQSDGSSAQFKIGSLEQGDVGDGCVTLPGEGLIRSPSISRDGFLLHLWYVSAPSADAEDWTLHYARGFNGIDWYPVDAIASLGEAAFDGGNPEPTLLKFAFTGDVFRMSGASVGRIGSDVGLQGTNLQLGGTLAFSIFTGHVLGPGPSGALTSRYDADDSESIRYLGPAAWDSDSVRSPAIEVTSQALYYTGNGLEGTTAIGIALPAPVDDETPSQARKWTNEPEAPSYSSDANVWSPSVVTVGGITYLYFARQATNGERDLFVTTRTDGGAWSEAVPVFGTAQVGDSVSYDDPSVLAPDARDALWHMWFSDFGGGAPVIRYGWSTDGLSWTLGSQVVLESGAGRQLDDEGVEAPSVVRRYDVDGTPTYQLWYTGFSSVVYQIFLARAEGALGADVETLRFTRYIDLESGETLPVLSPASNWWDVETVSDPAVMWMGDRYRMWYEGWHSDYGQLSHRIGLAESWDGTQWTRLYQPLTSEDAFTFRTSVVSAGSEQPDGTGEQNNLTDGAISLEYPTLNFSGVGATEVAVSPDRSIAVVGARYTPGLYVIDTSDNSSGDFFDSNYNGIEAILTWQSNTDREGVRAVAFHPSGDLIYALTAYPDSILVFDRSKILDRPSGVALLNDEALLGAIEMPAGLIDDEGALTSSDVGPIGFAIRQDGRYMWVAAANANSVVTIDLARKNGLGEVSAITRDVGELPSALVLSPDERYLFVSNYIGEIDVQEDKRQVVHSTIAVLDADPDSPTFGRLIARIKNLEP